LLAKAACIVEAVAVVACAWCETHIYVGISAPLLFFCEQPIAHASEQRDGSTTGARKKSKRRFERKT